MTERRQKELLEPIYKEIQQDRQERILWLQEHPADTPNAFSNIAIVEGILLSNTVGFRKGDLVPLMRFGDETILTWKHERNEYSVVIAKVDLDVKNNEYWLTFGYLFDLAHALSTNFEHKIECSYKWIYSFDKNKPIKEQDYGGQDGNSRNGTVNSLSDLLKILPIINLLYSDQKFLTAVQNLDIAHENHRFCHICALQKEGSKSHPNHEPKNWEHVGFLPKLDVGILFATRAIEALIGKPPNRQNQNSLLRFKKKWKDDLGMEPDGIFEMVNKSYLDYYYDLFSLRNSSAHSFGEIPFALTRITAIHAQAFSWQITRNYFMKHKSPLDEAIAKFGVNTKFINSEPTDYSTRQTAENREGSMNPDESCRG